MNQEIFNNLLSYLKYLHVTGKLSESAYETLVAQALSSFIANMIGRKIEEVVSEAFEKSLDSKRKKPVRIVE